MRKWFWHPNFGVFFNKIWHMRFDIIQYDTLYNYIIWHMISYLTLDAIKWKHFHRICMIIEIPDSPWASDLTGSTQNLGTSVERCRKFIAFFAPFSQLLTHWHDHMISSNQFLLHMVDFGQYLSANGHLSRLAYFMQQCAARVFPKDSAKTRAPFPMKPGSKSS